MPRLETPHFGPVDYSADDIVRFPEGLPAFEQENRFLLMSRPETRPILFLQSVQTPGLAFAALPVLAIQPGYRLAAEPEDLHALELSEGWQPQMPGEALCVAILTLSETTPTANLASPVVINLRTKAGRQIVPVSSPYSHRHVLLPEPEGTCS